MADALASGASVRKDVGVQVYRERVSVIYTYPKSKQPSTRTFFAEHITQLQNQWLAWSYRRVIKKLGDGAENLLEALKREKPRLYRRLMHGARQESIYNLGTHSKRGAENV